MVVNINSLMGIQSLASNLVAARITVCWRKSFFKLSGNALINYPQRNIWHNSHIKVNSNTSSFVRNMSSSSSQPGEKDDVIFEVEKDKGIVTLNRPKALNALNLSMIRKIYPKLKQWEEEAKFVIIRGAGEKAFCAGGDVRAVTESAKEETDLYRNFFKEEYQLNNLIGTYHLPYVALIDGITMGGGVGLSVHGTFRVATEKTVFAMPETGIGLFPDVGGSYFLPRLGGRLGMYLALTGYRLKGSDVLKAGIATHMCDSSNLPNLQRDLIALKSCNYKDIESVLSKYQGQCSQVDTPFSLKQTMAKINSHFDKGSVEEIISSLKADGSDWANKTMNTLSKMSPTSLKITHKLLIVGAEMDLQECLKIEYRLSQRCCEDHDFREGIRAVLVDRDQSPKWNPASLEQVTDKVVERYFSPLEEASQECKL